MKPAPLLKRIAPALLLVGLVGCDAVETEPAATASSKARHWDLYPTVQELPEGRAALLAHPDSIDIFVTFVDVVLSPEEASDDAFSEQDVRRRNYVRDGNPGVAATVSILDLPFVIAALEANPIVKYIEPDFSLLSPDPEGNYVPLSHDYTGQPWDRNGGSF